MTIGVFKETFGNKVGLVPKVIKKLIKRGYSVLVEAKAGRKAFTATAEFEAVGAKICSREDLFEKADILLSFTPFSDEEIHSIRPGCIYISHFKPYIYNGVAEKLEKRNIWAFSLDMIPRSSIAQSMDALSSMSSIAGYKAVLRAADLLPRYLQMMITSAGSIKPAQVFVIGVGVAGLQAIATAKRLGAVVIAMDMRPETEDEVKSLGAKFLKVPEDRQPTPVDQSHAQKTTSSIKQQQLLSDTVADSDVVICAATVRAAKAPIIITKEMVERMKRGSVIVDLAADAGGNCELTENDKTIVHNYVTIVGDSNLSDAAVVDASALFANNVYNFLKHISNKGDLQIRTDMGKDEIFSSSCIARPH
ncbi:NAD(P) transhydrogenase subunit alpha [Flavobacteriaceae bacterium TP-CH-4]|uniref:proton-translocating NAD(P)(+) transhydrogenase n=1 Tax=Pelagihabitans pacificus TaxID=2696054 RepID=A0A967EDS6_9FLAO|nr:NAD(P) transhydrogenase subunit alpha [Pelagihabitans pacificus]NHF59643.1 NAD(P) transhydrogenase subunit alpha [Pelagihabitans pacificus]